MSNTAAISLTTGLEDAERVTVALLVAVGAAESHRPTLMFLTKEAVRIALDGVAVGTACDGCPSIPDLLGRYAAAGGRLLVCPICFNSKKLDATALVSNAELGGTVQLWEWIGDGATTFRALLPYPWVETGSPARPGGDPLIILLGFLDSCPWRRRVGGVHVERPEAEPLAAQPRTNDVDTDERRRIIGGRGSSAGCSAGVIPGARWLGGSGGPAG